jgi:hypothetical protein
MSKRSSEEDDEGSSTSSPLKILKRPRTQEELMHDFQEWVRTHNQLRSVRLLSGDLRMKEGDDPTALVFELQRDLRQRLLRSFFLEQLDTLAMLDAATYRYLVDDRWYGLGLIDLLKDDHFWKSLWKRDFADQRQEIGDRVPSWIINNLDQGALQWRRYWVWTFFFRRTLCKMVVSQLNQREGRQHYAMITRSDRAIMDTQTGTQLDIWDLQSVVRPGLDSYFQGLADGNVRHGIPLVCGSMLRYLFMTNGKTDVELRSFDFVRLWTGTEHLEIPVMDLRDTDVNRELWVFPEFVTLTNVRPSRSVAAIWFAKWYWQTTLAVHGERRIQAAVRTDAFFQERADNRSRARLREALWFYYFEFRYRKFPGVIRRTPADFVGRLHRRIEASANLKQLPALPHTEDEDFEKLFLGNKIDRVGCRTCGEAASQRCKRCKKAHYCSKTCQKKHWHRHRLDCRLPKSDPILRGTLVIDTND